MWHILWALLAQGVAIRRRIRRLRVRTLAILELPLHFLFRGIAWARIHGLGARAHGLKRGVSGACATPIACRSGPSVTRSTEREGGENEREEEGVVERHGAGEMDCKRHTATKRT